MGHRTAASAQFHGAGMLFAFPDPDVYDAGTAESTLQSGSAFDDTGKQLEATADSARKYESRAAILTVTAILRGIGVAQEDSPWIFRWSLAAWPGWGATSRPRSCR